MNKNQPIQSQRFLKKNRLRTRSDFKDLFLNAKRMENSDFRVFFQKNTVGYPRIGVIVPKRYVKSAVMRNRIKRLIRENFRMHLVQLNAYDLLIYLKKSLNLLDDSELKTHLTLLWKNIASQEQISSLLRG